MPVSSTLLLQTDPLGSLSLVSQFLFKVIMRKGKASRWSPTHSVKSIVSQDSKWDDPGSIDLTVVSIPPVPPPRRLTHLSQSESRRSVFLRVEWNLERMRRGGRGEEEMLGEWTNLDRTDPINISNGPSATFFLAYDGEISFSFQRDQENQPVKLDPKDRRIRRWESQTVCQSFIKSS